MTQADRQPTPARPEAQLAYGREARVPPWLRLVCLAGAIVATVMGFSVGLGLVDQFIGLGTSISYTWAPLWQVDTLISSANTLLFVIAAAVTLPAALGRTWRTTAAGICFASISLLVLINMAVALASGAYADMHWYYACTSVAWGIQSSMLYALLAALLIEPIRNRLGLPTHG